MIAFLSLKRGRVEKLKIGCTFLNFTHERVSKKSTGGMI
jgi:hypothetical protein